MYKHSMKHRRARKKYSASPLMRPLEASSTIAEEIIVTQQELYAPASALEDAIRQLDALSLDVALVNPPEAQTSDTKDFDLGVRSREKDDHPPMMEGLDLDDGTSSTDQKQGDPIEECIQSLVHARQCRDANCMSLMSPSCLKMKRFVQHTKTCKLTVIGNCPICKPLAVVCRYHAEHCDETECPVPFCMYIKHKLRQQQILKTCDSESVPGQLPSQSSPYPLTTTAGPPVAAINAVKQVSVPQNTMIGSVPPDQGSAGMGPPLSQGGPGLHPAAARFQQTLQILRSGPSQQRERLLLQVLKSNPSLVAAFLEHRSASQHRQQK